MYSRIEAIGAMDRPIRMAGVTNALGDRPLTRLARRWGGIVCRTDTVDTLGCEHDTITCDNMDSLTAFESWAKSICVTASVLCTITVFLCSESAPRRWA